MTKPKQVITKPQNLIQVVAHNVFYGGFETIKSITNVECQDGKSRTFYTTHQGQADTYFSAPGYVYVWDVQAKKNVKVTGSIYCRSELEKEDAGDSRTYIFHANYYNRNARLVVPMEEVLKAYAEYMEADDRRNFHHWTYDPTLLV